MSRNRATLRAPEEAVRDGARMINEREELIEIEDLTLGPLGIGRLDGKAVMVANSAPGDVLQVNITEEHRDYLLARLNSVLKSGPARRAAPCIYLPRCGGCDWQQIDYPQQLALKARLIAAELKRALGVDLDPAELIVPAPAEFGYRSRVRLKVSRNGALGFFETASNRLVEVDRCLIAGDDLSFAPGRRLALALRGRCDEIEIVKAGGRQVLVANLRGRVQASDTAKAGEALAGDGIVAGIVLRGGGDRVGIGYVSATVELEPGMILRAAADAFSQTWRAGFGSRCGPDCDQRRATQRGRTRARASALRRAAGAGDGAVFGAGRASAAGHHPRSSAQRGAGLDEDDRRIGSGACGVCVLQRRDIGA
jgi:predicted RNA-binding protein with TRAM domain